MSQDNYQSDLLAWRQQQENSLRSENGWLTLTGLFVLSEGPNSVGSRSTADIRLPGSAPGYVGYIDFKATTATFHLAEGINVLANGEPVAKEIVLQDDSDHHKPTIISVDSVSFFLLKRDESYAIRVRDRNNPDRANFQGRHWFDPDLTYQVEAHYTPHPATRYQKLETSSGLYETIENIGYVTFSLAGQALKLEAFSDTPDSLWFIFKDQSSGALTYGLGRFLRGKLNRDGRVNLDFNRAYHPPCAFTHFATCPLPLRENYLPISILAGEKL